MRMRHTLGVDAKGMTAAQASIAIHSDRLMHGIAERLHHLLMKPKFRAGTAFSWTHRWQHERCGLDLSKNKVQLHKLVELLLRP
jgi:hypothetical protein